MSDFKNGRFDSKKQEWTTPDTIFVPLEKEFNFTIDLAADANNSKCGLFFDEKQDSMSQPWNGIGWLNPPYGLTGKHSLNKWVKKSFDESRKPDCIICMLVPARTNTKWWHEFCMKASEVRFIEGRPKFGDAPFGTPQPLAIIIFRNDGNEIKFSSFKI